MFIGHFACGFAAQRWARRQSLLALMLAPLLLDVLWPIFCLLGIERFRIAPGAMAYTPLIFDHYPWSHSLLMAVVWAVLYGLAVDTMTRDRAGARIAALLVVSHWVLDFVTHHPDMPLWPGGPKVGLGLWQSIPATVAVESLMFITGVASYLRVTRARDRTGSIALWALIVLLAVAYAANSAGTAPPSVMMVTASALVANAVTVLWLWWIDRHREVMV